MARIKNILLLIAITFSTSMVFAACSGDETVGVIPTPAGQVAGEPTLIYLWNFPWPAWEQMSPIVNGLEAEYDDHITFQRLNVDERDGRLAAQHYQVRGHPAILIVDVQGAVVWRRVGVISEADLVTAIEKYIDQ